MLTLLLLMLLSPPDHLLFDFKADADLSAWRVVDDGVMGGLSAGHFDLSDEGHGIFRGRVSLENNGGFSSLRYRLEPTDVSAFKRIVLRVKGNGERYQLRCKSSQRERHSYVQYFQTSGDWETITLQLADFEPAFRGRQLAMENYPARVLAELGILIGNGKAQDFKLEIDWIGLE